MEYQLYYGNSELMLEEIDNSPNSKNSWVDASTSDTSMDNGFEWSELKIDESDTSSQHHQQEDNKNNNNNINSNNDRKRKFDETDEQIEENGQIRRVNFLTSTIDMRRVGNMKKIVESSTGLLKIPLQWNDDIGDLNSDIIDSSLTALENTSYTMGGPCQLSIPGLTVFKQEAPSPTHDVNGLQQICKRNVQSPTANQDIDRTNQLNENSNDQQMINNTITQLLNQSDYSNLQNTFDANLIGSPSSQHVTSSNLLFSEDSRFQYVLAAATSIATKMNEDTLTYLNQGQSYEIKLKKLGDLSMYRGKMLKSIVRICFHERRLQFMEKEQMALWQKARPGDRILDIDIPLSYGAIDIIQPNNALNLIHFNWDPTKEVGVYIKVNCISTEFTPKKHGGEKGVPFRIQVETYPITEGNDISKRLHAAACQIKVFKLKGADRKHKQDREKIMKRPMSEQEKYQPSYECTVLSDIPNDAVLSSPPIAPLSPAGSDTSSTKSNSYLTPINQGSPTLPVMKQQQQQPIVQIVAPLQHTQNIQEPKQDIQTLDPKVNIKATSTNQDVIKWLMENRLDNFIETFQNFNGRDLLRLTRNDVLQICGEADGIRFFNILHDKAITPRSKIYICKANSNVFHAIFLSSTCKDDLKQELCDIVGLLTNQVNDMYMEGPNNIHVIISNSVIYHIKEESAFSINILKEKDYYALLLKPIK